MSLWQQCHGESHSLGRKHRHLGATSQLLSSKLCCQWVWLQQVFGDGDARITSDSHWWYWRGEASRWRKWMQVICDLSSCKQLVQQMWVRFPHTRTATYAIDSYLRAGIKIACWNVLLLTMQISGDDWTHICMSTQIQCEPLRGCVNINPENVPASFLSIYTYHLKSERLQTSVAALLLRQTRANVYDLADLECVKPARIF